MISRNVLYTSSLLFFLYAEVDTEIIKTKGILLKISKLKSNWSLFKKKKLSIIHEEAQNEETYWRKLPRIFSVEYTPLAFCKWWVKSCKCVNVQMLPLLEIIYHQY